MLRNLSFRARSRAATLGSLLVVIAVGVAAYRYAIELPLYWDDIWMLLGHVRPYTLPQILLRWRPIQLATNRIFYDIQGTFNSSSMYLFSLCLHILNSCLCYVLLAHLNLKNRRLFALGGALFYILYPFSAQAVAWVAALGHLWVGTLVLGALVFYQLSRNRRKGSIWLRGASLVCTLLAPFANEAGLVIFILIALLLLAERTPLKSRDWLGIAPYIVCAAISMVVMRLVRPHDSRIASFVLSLDDIKYKTTYALQALVYPFAPIVTWLYRRGIPISSNTFAFISYFFIFLVYLWVCRRMHILRYAILGACWFFVTIAPATIIMATDYVLSGPRLMYIGAFGASLFWALPLTMYDRLPFRQGIRSIIAIVFIVAVACSGMPYLNSVRGLSLETKKIVEELKTTYRDISNPVLSVNFPSALFLKQEVNLVGNYRPSILPESNPEDLDNLLALNGAPGHQIKHLRIQEYFPQDDWKYIIAYWMPNSTPTELATELRDYPSVFRAAALDTIVMREAGGLEAAAVQPSVDYLAQFDSQMALLSSTIANSGTEYTLTLRWQCLQPIMHQMQIFVHVYDKDGNLVVGQDQQPLLGLSDVLTWQAGDIWRDVRYITLPENMTAGDYAVVVGMYTLPDMVRLPAYTSSGQRLEDEIVILETISVP